MPLKAKGTGTVTNPPEKTKPVVSDERFMANVREAHENGYDRVCAFCGTGTFDGMEMHERRCPEFQP